MSRGPFHQGCTNTLKIRAKTLHFLLFQRPGGASLGRILGPALHFLPFQLPGGASLGRHLGPAGSHGTNQVFKILEKTNGIQTSLNSYRQVNLI